MRTNANEKHQSENNFKKRRGERKWVRERQKSRLMFLMHFTAKREEKKSFHLKLLFFFIIFGMAKLLCFFMEENWGKKEVKKKNAAKYFLFYLIMKNVFSHGIHKSWVIKINFFYRLYFFNLGENNNNNNIIERMKESPPGANFSHIKL